MSQSPLPKRFSAGSFSLDRIRALAAVACLMLAGCSTPEVNPPTPRANTGYVDFYTDTNLGLSWEVKRATDPGGKMATVFSKLDPVQGTVLRLAAPPGKHQFQVWFINQVTEGPQTVLVEVGNGMVTPVHVTLTPTGSTTVYEKVYAYRGSAKGYARGTKISSNQSEVYRIGAVAEAPQAYQPKERMPYSSPQTK